MVVITGGASGLGLLIAEVYGMRGVTVAVLDVREPEGGEARNVEFYKCDVGDRKQVEAVAKDIERDLGTPTVLINNAAIVNGKKILDLSAEEIETYVPPPLSSPVSKTRSRVKVVWWITNPLPTSRNFKTNLLSSFYTIKQFLPGMLKLNRGSIITVSSVLSSIAPAQLSDYAASKAALKSLHSSLTAELAHLPGIKTLLVTPGQLSTPLFYGVETPSNFFAPVLEPVDVAKEIIAAIDGGLGGHISMPVYSRWIGVMEVLPVSVQKFLRWASGTDRAMAGFKGRKVLDQEEKEAL